MNTANDTAVSRDDTRAVPQRSRPNFKGYGITKQAEGMLDWSWVTDRMGKSRNYWIVSVRPDGSPHAAPVWGVWMDETLYFGSGIESQKAKNLRANPAVVVHLESGDETVIFEGEVRELAHDRKDIYERLAKEYAAKYPPFEPEPGPEPEAITFELIPSRVMAWTEADYPNTATEWRLPAT
jgi:nitroimidazol reductase NimA-like FMN-containing flavoprotein (pyridoxamine 5'-phosphate oxidase superfamily)